MSENIFWVYNGWAILITTLAPIYTMVQAQSQMYSISLRSLFPIFILVSIILLFILSNWVTVVMYIPCWIVGVMLGSIVKHRGLGG